MRQSQLNRRKDLAPAPDLAAMVAKLPLAPELGTALVKALTDSNCQATIDLDLSGTDGAFVTLEVKDGVRVVDYAQTVDVIVRARRSRFEAILRGNLSVADAEISDRLTFSGDLAKITLVRNALAVAQTKL